MSRLFKSRFTYILITSLTVGGILLSALGLPQSSVKAEASLSINPLTWNVVGLDSNKVTVGPENFPVGVRVCNAGPDEATNVTATFVWDDGKGLYFPSDDYINLRADSLPSITIPSLGDDECYDYYFEVAVTRNSASYDKTRRYHIEITADGGISLSTPRPREIFVERLVSQSRNYTLDVRLDGQSIPAGGTMAMAIGNTYEIQLVGSTATNGYEQLETFINFPNTIFQVNSVVTTFSANGGTDPDAASKLYADGCRWENDPNSPNYRACLGTGKYGGNITVTYNLTIIADEGSTQTLNTLIYDFSGSSYHYNADYSIGGRIAVIIDPTTSAGFAKRFIPSTIANDGISTLRFTITNPHPVTVSGYKFDDTLPGAIVVADLANIDNGCGGTVTALPDSGTISLTGGELAPNTSCTILVDVTAPYDAGVTYPLQNLVDLYVGDAASPAATATAPLTVTATQPPPLTCQDITNQLIAQWSSFTLANNPTHPPTGPLNGLGVTTAAGAGLITTVGTNRWVASNVPSGETLATARTNNRYYEFVVNTAGLDNVNISFQASRQNSNGPSTITLDYGPAGSLTQGAQTWGPVSTNAGTPSTFTVSNLTNLSPDGNTYFRFYVYGASNPNIEIRIHDMSLNGSGTICTPNLGTPPNPPTLSKQFAPDEVRVGEVSTLTFAITNPNASDALSGITFRDELPAGMTAVAGTFVNSGCSGIWGLESGNPAILLFTGGALAGNISCTLSVNVVSTSVGPNLNISDPIDSTETLAGNSATDTLNVLPPPTAPVIFKQFDPNPLLDPAGSTTLTFRITNTDPALAISGVAFTDTLPTAPVVMQPVAPFNYSDNSKCGSGYSFTWNAGTNQLAFSGGAIAAGATCEIDVDVEVPGVDISGGAVSFLNQTSTVSHVFNGTAYQGNDAEATLVVDSPNPALNFLKQVGPADTGPWSDFLAVEPLGNVYYRFVVENTGDVALNNIIVADNVFNISGCIWVDGNGNTLADTDAGAPGVQFTLPVADADEGHLAYCVPDAVTALSGWNNNTASANSNETEAAYPAAYPVSSTASYATTGLTLDKSTSTVSFANENNPLSYSYLITNTGSAPLKGPVVVTDNKIVAPNEVTCQDVADAVVGVNPGDGDNFLDPGESVTCTATYLVTADDVMAGSVTNTAYAVADSVQSNNDSVTVAMNAPALTVAKSSTTTSLSAPGTVTYSYLVTNTGSVTLTGISLSDDNDNDDMSCPGTTLAVGASMTCSATHTFTQAELDAGGNLSNTVTASSNEAPDATDSLDIPIMQNPALNIEKLTNGQDADVPPGPTVMIGDPVAWTYVVTNTGNVALTNVTVTDDKGVTVTCPQTTLAVAESMTCTASGTAQLGQYANIGTVTAYYGATLVNDSDASHYFGTSTPLIGAAKRIVGTPTLVSPGTWEITYEILVRNYGEDALSKIQITDNLAVTFPPATAFAVQSLTSANFAVNWPGYTGSTDTNLLAGTDTLNVGASGTLTLVVRIVPAAAGPFQNTAIASGQPPSGDPVNDSSHNGTNPDPDNDGNPTNNNAPTPVTFDASIFDPPFGIKVFDDSGLPLLRWRMVWINESNLSPLAAQVSDPIPVGTTFAPSGAPNPYPFPAAGYPAVPGSTNVGVSCQRDGVLTTTANCYYEGPSGAYLRGRIIWVGTFGPDLGNFTEATAQNELVITYNVTINDGVSTVRNVATLDADLSTDGDFEDPNETGVAVATSTWSQAAAARTDTPGKPQPKKLPATGFAPGIVSKLPLQPLALVYSAYSDLKVEIPSLKVKVDIVGVPVVENQWDITWLGANAGYLDGTAFPTWVGNSVITGHVYLSNGLPGPFVNLSKLKWGDRIVIHAYGQKYIYEVRSALTVRPEDTTVLGHKDRDWVTLITCKEFDETSKTYKMRTAVQAVLISVIADRVEEHGGR